MSLGVEYFNLIENLDGRGELVNETGPMFVLGVDWTPGKNTGLIWGYRGEFYTGNVDYDGQTQLGEPYLSTTEYLGTSQEGRLAWGWQMKSQHIVEVQSALGLEVFRRSIVNGGTGDQMEDYQILYARLGGAYSGVASNRLSFNAGIKYPMAVREDAHLNELGLEDNPTLEPRSLVSLYAGMEFRFSKEFLVRLYYDGYRFETSDPVTVTASRTIGSCGVGTVCSVIQPQTTIHRLGVAIRTAF